MDHEIVCENMTVNMTFFFNLTVFVAVLCSGTALSPTSLQHGHSHGFLTNYTTEMITENALWIKQPIFYNNLHLGKGGGAKKKNSTRDHCHHYCIFKDKYTKALNYERKIVILNAYLLNFSQSGPLRDVFHKFLSPLITHSQPDQPSKKKKACTSF